MKNIFYNRHTPFWLITIAVLIGLTVPVLIQDGMFMDAMLYTSVSHNLSQGIGTFWFPQFSLLNVGGLPSFHEQPPLVFGIQSLFFRLFGDSMYIERLYTFLTMCITAFLIHRIWREIFSNGNKLKFYSWIPLILWITIPVCFWSYSNNMHENTMGIFTLTSVLFTYKALRATKFQILMLVTSGIFIFLATFSKGLPGFFPISVPFLYWLTTKKIKFSKAIFYTFIIIIIPLIGYFILFLIPESNESLSTYLFKRAFHRINEVPTVENRFYILYRIFTELLPQILFIGLLFLVSAVRKIKTRKNEQIRESLFFISVGLSASVPLMLTLVQKGFYFVPALPMFSIGLSILAAPIILNLTERIDIYNNKFKIFLIFSAILFVFISGFALMQKGKVSRNKEMLNDVYLIGKVVPTKSTISIPQAMWNDNSLQCYLIRYFNISVEPGYCNQFFLLDNQLKDDSLINFKKIDIQTQKYTLYKRIE
ncbi:MAG: glycosyltransferase family 39 protein [Bacteroidota bacterium]